MLLTLWEAAMGRPVDGRVQTLLQTLSLVAGVAAVAWLDLRRGAAGALGHARPLRAPQARRVVPGPRPVAWSLRRRASDGGPAVTDAAPRFPPQIRYIIGNEAAERFSFYGMRNILTVFLVDYLLTRHTGNRSDQAQAVFHTFVMGVFLFPLLGGVLADWWWGKYRTVLWLSLVYVAGHACLAFFERQRGRLLHGAVPHRARIGRHQALRVVLRRRPVHRRQPVAGPQGVRLVLLVHQPRQLLRLGHHPQGAGALRTAGGLRHPRSADGRGHPRVLGRPQAVREGSAPRARPARLPLRALVSGLFGKGPGGFWKRTPPSTPPRRWTVPAQCSAWRASSRPSPSSGPASTRRRRCGCSRPGTSTSGSARSRSHRASSRRSTRC